MHMEASNEGFARPSGINDSVAATGKSKKGGTGGGGGLRGLAAQFVRKRKRPTKKDSSVDGGDVFDEPEPDGHVEENGDSDTSSLASLENISPPDRKRARPGLKGGPRSSTSSASLSRMTSLASVFCTPMAKVARVGSALNRSISSAKMPTPCSPSPSASLVNVSTPTKFFNRSISTIHMNQNDSGKKNSESPFGNLKRGGSGRGSSARLTPYKPPQPTPNKQRPTRFWSLQFQNSCSALEKHEIKLQEAIYEISCGEEDLVQDMDLVERTYAESMLHLNILTQDEVNLIFGKLKLLSPLHINLYRDLRALRSAQTGISRPIGRTLLGWVSKIEEAYTDYCASLITIKAFLDSRMESDKDFSDFLQRCLESPFSRKLDLWSYLDVPRSRLVKYPLLFKQVLSYTECNAERSVLGAAIREMEDVLRSVDKAMAAARCRHTISRLDWLDDSIENMEAVKNATEEVIEGVLRNNRGTKLECHLMDTVLIMGRPSTRGKGGYKRLQVYRTPIPVEDLVVEDLDTTSCHGSGSSTSSTGSGKHGSFKAAFTSSQGPRNSFRVGFRDDVVPICNSAKKQLSHTLTARDEHSKRQWLTALQKTIDMYRLAQRQSIIEEEEEEKENSRASKRAPSRTALFTKKKRSPRIKASLSSAAIENLKRGGGPKRLRPLSSTSSLDHSVTPAVLNTPSGIKPKIMHRNKKVATIQRDRNTSTEVFRWSKNLRGRTQSWSHLHHNQPFQEEPRYLTRSKVKISKSMSDLVKVM